tara:strand:+ start:1051 stop:1362 length:312 start_codon:yes stop_codon:yes gene_type:complete
MKVIPFPLNEKDFSVSYYRTREGPNWFLCYYKDASKGQVDPMEAWRTLGKAKFTDTGKKLKEWCQEMHDTYGPKDYTDNIDKEVSDMFFDHMPEPNDNTKMVM